MAASCGTINGSERMTYAVQTQCGWDSALFLCGTIVICLPLFAVALLFRRMYVNRDTLQRFLDINHRNHLDTLASMDDKPSAEQTSHGSMEATLCTTEEVARRVAAVQRADETMSISDQAKPSMPQHHCYTSMKTVATGRRTQSTCLHV